MKDVSAASVYFLLLELLNEGEAGLLPEIEPINEDEIISALEKKTKRHFGRSKDDWIQWFLGDDEYGSELERSNLLIFVKTQETMSRIIKKLGIE